VCVCVCVFVSMSVCVSDVYNSCNSLMCWSSSDKTFRHTLCRPLTNDLWSLLLQTHPIMSQRSDSERLVDWSELIWDECDPEVRCSFCVVKWAKQNHNQICVCVCVYVFVLADVGSGWKFLGFWPSALLTWSANQFSPTVHFSANHQRSLSYASAHPVPTRILHSCFFFKLTDSSSFCKAH